MIDRETAMIMGYAEDAERPKAYFGSEFFNRAGQVSICCERPGEKTPVWNTELTYYVGSLRETVRLCGDGTVLCGIANLFVRLDPESGEVVGKTEMTAPAVDDIFENGSSQMVILNDGSRGLYTFEDDSCYCAQHFDVGVRRVRMTLEPDEHDNPMMHLYVLMDRSDMVRRYVSGGTVMDGSYQTLDWALDTTSLVIPAGDSLLIGGSNTVSCMDRATGTLGWQLTDKIVEASEDYKKLELLGITTDGVQAIVGLDYDGALFGTVDIATGTFVEHRLEDMDGKLWELAYFSDALCLLGDMVCGLQIAGGDGEKELRTYDLITGARNAVPLGKIGSCVMAAAGDRLLLRTVGEDGIPLGWLIDPETGNMTSVERIGEWDTGLACRDDGYLAMLDGSDVILLKPDGTLERVIETEGPGDALSFVPNQDALLLLGSNDQLYVYGLDGTRRAVIDLDISDHALYPRVRWQLDDGQCVLYLNVSTYLIDPEIWTLELTVDLCFYVEGDRFYCLRPDETGASVAAYYTRYTPEKLMEKGREQIGGQALRDPEKYGLK